jgi:cephalosporin hydroxylase
MNQKFEKEKSENIHRLGANADLKSFSNKWIADVSRYKYLYNFTWLGRPIIQFPQDIMAMQEIIWRVKPDLIVKTSIAHGGSLVFYASTLGLIGASGHVLGIDVDIREHNRDEIEKHPMSKRIAMIEGSSVDNDVVSRVYDFARGKRSVLVILDSNHAHQDALKELELYSPLAKKGSYLVVFDTVIEDLPENFFPDRLWGKGNNPKTAVWEFLKANDRFEIDKDLENKLLITVAPGGYLRCVKD